MFELNLVIYHHVKPQRQTLQILWEKTNTVIWIIAFETPEWFFKMLFIFKKSEEDLEIEIKIQNLFLLDCNWNVFSAREKKASLKQRDGSCAGTETLLVLLF